MQSGSNLANQRLIARASNVPTGESRREGFRQGECAPFRSSTRWILASASCALGLWQEGVRVHSGTDPPG